MYAQCQPCGPTVAADSSYCLHSHPHYQRNHRKQSVQSGQGGGLPSVTRVPRLILARWGLAEPHPDNPTCTSLLWRRSRLWRAVHELASQPEALGPGTLPEGRRTAEVFFEQIWRGNKVYELVEARGLWTQERCLVHELVSPRPFSTACGQDPAVVGPRSECSPAQVASCIALAAACPRWASAA